MIHVPSADAFEDAVELVIGGAMGALAYDGIQRVTEPAANPLESVLLAIGGIGWTLLLFFLMAYVLYAFSRVADGNDDCEQDG